MIHENMTQLIRDHRGRELEIGLALGSLTDDDLERLGHRSLSDCVRESLLDGVDTPDYSTVMRWVRAGSVLDGPDDPRAEWGLSKLAELSKLDTCHRDAFLQEHDPGGMSVRELRSRVSAVIGEARVSPEIDEPHRILERAIDAYLRHNGTASDSARFSVSRGRGDDAETTVSISSPRIDTDLSRVMAGASEVTGAIATAKAAWRRVTNYEPPSVPAPMQLEEIDALPPGQLTADWETPDIVRISKGGTPILRLPVRRPGHGETRMMQSSVSSNRKLRGVFGLIDCISQGCLRRATGWDGCGEPCFALQGVERSGCYADQATWPWWKRKEAEIAKKKPEGAAEEAEDYDLMSNGLTSNHMALRIPANGSPDLGGRTGDLWRIDAETADGAMSISLGLFQMWAESNPDKRSMTICSHAFRPSDEMLAWLSALRNAWVGTTVSAALGRTELDVRFGAAERLIGWGVPSTIWIVTHEDWENAAVLERALGLVGPEAIIESPYRPGHGKQHMPLLGINPLGSCGDRRVTIDHEGIERDFRVIWDEDPATSEVRARLVGEHGGEPGDLTAHSKCIGCRLLCGVHVLDDR